MQLVANQKLVRNRGRVAWVLYIAAMGVFVFGLFTNNSTALTPEATSIESVVLPWATIVVGIVLWFTALSQLRRWGPRRRQDRQIATAIRGLDDRYKVYAYLASDLPDFIVTGPGGVHVVVTRAEGGAIQCDKDVWKKAGQNILTGLFDTPFGNPSADARKGVARVKRLLEAEGQSDIPVNGIVLLTNDRASPRVSGCTFPVTKLKGLKDVLLRAAGKGKNVAVPLNRVREIQDILDRRMASANAWR